MINKEQILRCAISIENEFVPVIYILISGSDIVYVGKSVNPMARISLHRCEKVFDKFTILKYSDFGLEPGEFEDLYASVEEILIMKFTPRYNKSIDGILYTSADMVKRDLGIGKWELRRLVDKYHIKHKILNGLLYYKNTDIHKAIDGETDG